MLLKYWRAVKAKLNSSSAMFAAGSSRSLSLNRPPRSPQIKVAISLLRMQGLLDLMSFSYWKVRPHEHILFTTLLTYMSTTDPELQPTKPDLRLLDVNLTGVMYTAKLAMHFFRRQKLSPEYDRCLILKSSLAGYIDLPGAPIYNASKFGVRAIMRNLRWTAWQESTRVNVVAPWFVRTPLMTEGAMQHLESKGVDFAAEEDAVKTVLRIASDKTLNGTVLLLIDFTESN